MKITDQIRKRLIGGLFVGLIVAASSVPAAAQPTMAQAQAITLKPLSLINLTPLKFGGVIAGTAAGKVIVDPDNDARSTTGGVTAAGGGPAAARFLTYGGPLQFVQVNRGPLPVLTRTGGTQKMNVDNLTLNGPVNRFLNGAGLLDLRVGGQLAVKANQTPGEYTGNFLIYVTYY